MSRKRGSFVRGALCHARPGAGFAQANQVVTILEPLPGDRVRIAYGQVTDLIVNTRHLTPLVAAARLTDPATSHQAASAQTAPRVTTGQRAVLDTLALIGDEGLTDFELAERTGIKQTSIGVRRGELVKAGLVEATGAVRPSDTHSDAKCWRITTAGVAVWTDLQQRGAA